MGRDRFTKAEKSWILYDVGCSGLVFLASSVIPIYFNSLAAQDPVVEDVGVGAWGTTESIISLIIALLMPILGSIADMRSMRKKFIIITVAIGAVATIAMGFPSHWLTFLVVYTISAVMLNASFVFYDSLLLDVTTKNRIIKVSSSGFAWGYAGSCIPYIACILIVFNAEKLGISMQTGMLIAFIITAVWWVGFTVPMLKNVDQKSHGRHTSHPFADAARGLRTTMHQITANKSLSFFVMAYFFYIDGIHTMFKMATSYGANLGIDGAQMALALLVTQFIAWPASIIYGRLGHGVGTKKMLLIGVAAYFFITLYASFFMRTATEFWILAICVSLFHGGIQSLSRSEFAKLCPKDRANEYFGFFDVFGRSAAFNGTLLISAFTFLTRVSSWGMLAIAPLFILGFYFLLKVPDTR